MFSSTSIRVAEDSRIASTFFELLESDLRLLSSEATKINAASLVRWIGGGQSSDVPPINQSCDRAVSKLRMLAGEGRQTMEAIRDSPELLFPFLDACELKNARLAQISLSTFQKFASNDGLARDSRAAIIRAMTVAERLKDEGASLRALQTALVLMQNPAYADDEDGACQMLGLSFRIHAASSKGPLQNLTVQSTAAATIRQAVAIAFDHSILPSPPTLLPGEPPVSILTLPSNLEPMEALVGSGASSRPLTSHQSLFHLGHEGQGPRTLKSMRGASMKVQGEIRTTYFGDALGREAIALHLLLDIISLVSGAYGGAGGGAGGGGGGGGGPAPSPQPATSITSSPGPHSSSSFAPSSSSFHSSGPSLTGVTPLGGTWLKLLPTSPPPRTFLLELLEGVLMQRSPVFHHLPQMTVVLRQKVCPFIEAMMRSAIDPQVDPASLVDARLVMRCAGAMLKKHVQVAPDKCSSYMQALIRCSVNPNCQPWQRVSSLQALRQLSIDPLLLYRLFETYDLAMDFDLNAVGDLTRGLSEILKGFARMVGDIPDDDVMGALSSTLAMKAGGKDIALEAEGMCVNSMGHIPGSEVVLAYQALDCLLSSISALDELANMQAMQAAAGGAIDATATATTATAPGGGSRVGEVKAQVVRKDVIVNMIDAMWRPSLSALSPLLARCSMWNASAPSFLPQQSAAGNNPTSAQGGGREAANERDNKNQSISVGGGGAGGGGGGAAVVYNGLSLEPLSLSLLKGYHHYIHAAGSLQVSVARDRLLASLCEFSLSDLSQDQEDPHPHPHLLNFNTSGRLEAGALAAAIAAAHSSSTSSTTSPAPPLLPSTTSVLSSGGSHPPDAGAWLIFQRPPGVSPALLYSSCAEALMPLGPLTRLSSLNLAAIKTLLDLTSKLAPVLGTAWLFVVDVLTGLDRFVLAPYANASEDNGYDSLAPQIQASAAVNVAMADKGDVALSSSPPYAASISISSGGAPPLPLPLPLPPPLPLPGGHSELSLLSDLVDTTYESSRSLSTESVLSLLGALGEVSARCLPGQAPVGPPRLNALERMAQVVMSNAPFRVDELWPLFLSHVLEVLHSPFAPVRKVAMQALDMTVIGALSAAAAAVSAPSLFFKPPGFKPDSSATPRELDEDLQNMLLVALDSLFRSDPEPDVRRGLLKIAMNVLHHRGERLTRGWAPLLRLIEAVPTKGQEGGAMSLGFQCIQLIISDFLPALPKEHIPKTLEILALFSQQEVILNASLTAVTMLWNVSDVLARAPPAPSPSGDHHIKQELKSGLDPILTSQMSEGWGAAVSTSSSSASTISPHGGSPAFNLGPFLSTSLLAISRGGGHAIGRKDVSQAEGVELLRLALRALHAASKDMRHEVRNSGARTLFLAICSNGSRLSAVAWREVIFDLVLPLLAHTQLKCSTSSNEEVAASELGKDSGGRSVKMLMHHSRNTEQKQWDETLVLVLSGLSKVLKAFLPTLGSLEGFKEAWEQIVESLKAAIGGGRKALAVAGAALIVTLVQAYPSTSTSTSTSTSISSLSIPPPVPPPAPPISLSSSKRSPSISDAIMSIVAPLPPSPSKLSSSSSSSQAPPSASNSSSIPSASNSSSSSNRPLQPWMWRGLMSAIHQGIKSMATPGTTVQLQARTDLVACIASFYASVKDQMEIGDLRMMLKWLSRLARYSVGVEDQTGAWALAAAGQLSPVQKAVLSTFSAMVPLPPSLAEAAWPDLLTSLCDSIRPLQLAPYRFKPIREAKPLDDDAMEMELVDLAAEARSLTSAWLIKAIEMMSSWYKELSWPVRVSTFPLVVSRLSECMSVRHLWVTRPSDLPLVDHAPSSSLPSSQQTSSQQTSSQQTSSQQTPQPLYLAEVWRMAARAFVSVVNSGLPSINITTQSLIQQQQQQLATAQGGAAALTLTLPPGSSTSDTWDLLIKSFQMFLVGEGLIPSPPPPGDNEGEEITHLSLLPSLAAAALSSSSSSDDEEVQAMVLDCLGDTVLTSCQFAPLDSRLALIRILERGTHSELMTQDPSPSSSMAMMSQRPTEGGGGVNSSSNSLRFSHLGLSKLYVLCSRGGQDPSPAEQSVRCQLDIAQLSLPIFVSRAELILTQYLSRSADEERSRLTTSLDKSDQQLGSIVDGVFAEKARHVLNLVAQLWVSSSVGSSLIASRPHLKPWIDVARARKRPKAPSSSTGGAEASKAATSTPSTQPAGEQTHLLALYGSLCECAASGDPAIRSVASGLLLKIGKDVGLLSGTVTA